MAEPDKIWHGFYSAKSIESGLGSSFYKHVDGRIVEVTCVSETEDASSYHWADKKYVGMITKWISAGNTGNLSSLFIIANGSNQMNPCGNPKCSRSTGIHDGITCGSGKLSSNGFWEFPCRVCAEAWDKENHKENVREEMRQHFLRNKDGSSFTQKDIENYIENYIRESVWLNTPAWPFAKNK